jgi:hypothetical protein
MSRVAAGSILAGLALVLSTGCGPTECERLCARNRDCLAPDLDVVACASDCQREVDASRSVKARVERCLECMEETACEIVVDVCFSDCT